MSVLDNVMVGALTRTRDVRHARERARTLLERVGLGWLEMTLLCVVERVGGLSQQALADRALVDRTRVSAAARRLESEGLVVREPGADGRQVRVSLTQAGSRWTREGVEELRLADQALLPRLRDSERERLRALLEKGLVGWA